MNNNEIEIRSCGVCPFRYTEIDNFAVGCDTSEICVLSQSLNKKSSIICSYDGKFESEEQEERIYQQLNSVPKWCPLLDIPKLVLKLKDLPLYPTKPNEYDENGILQNMDVWDWVVTNNGEVRQITHHDMDDLKGEDIRRFATQTEINKQKDELQKKN